jgi:hypothetical protein
MAVIIIGSSWAVCSPSRTRAQLRRLPSCYGHALCAEESGLAEIVKLPPGQPTFTRLRRFCRAWRYSA